MSILLRLKHWQVFMLTFGLLVLAYIFLAVVGMSRSRELVGMTGYAIQAIPFVEIASFVIANFWVFVIGTRLYPKQEYYRDSLMLLIFRWCIYFSTLATSARLMIFPTLGFYGPINEYITILVIAGGIYCSYFAARLLNSVEQERAAPFREFVGDFILFIFYPIGVWWLQPRVNRIFGSDNPVYDPDAPLDQQAIN
ncbi:MAG: hypothetical protein WDO15_14855 [Bacteroidota bacterium]